MRKAVLQMEQVRKAYPTPSGYLEVLRNIDISIEAHELVMITGPSGSGKTTFINLAGLLDEPTSGRVIIDGCDTSKLDERFLAELRSLRTGMVFQRFHLLPQRTAAENVAFRFRYMDVPTAQVRVKVERIMREMGLEKLAETKAGRLSAGEMQRVAIARAVVSEPELLLADEPTGNLDSESAAVVMDILERLCQKGTAVVMATHNEKLIARATRHIECGCGLLEERPLA